MASASNLNSVGMRNTNSSPNHSSSHNVLITVTVFAVTVTIFLALYFILRYRCISLRRRFSPSSSTASTSGNRISPETTSSSVVDSLPMFSFSSITRRSSSAASGDCAVCLSKFEQHDLLRLLPLCHHAFHVECIDTWLRSNLTCPLCRSAVVASESELMKICQPSSASSGNSFRLEIGNVSSSRRGTAASDNVTGETDRRSYSVGAFEYFVDEEAEIPFGQTNRRIVSGVKDDAPAMAMAMAVEVPVVSQANLIGEGSWLKDYVDSLSSLMSFRNSGRFFGGSFRRNDVVGVGDFEVETNGFGEEITEMFRWISGF